MHTRVLDYVMHNYAQLCTIVHDHARLCGLHFDEDTGGLQTRGIMGLRSPKNRQYSKVSSSHSCAVFSEAFLNITIAHQHHCCPHFQTVEEFHRLAKHLQQWKHVLVHSGGQNCP